jgi:energy-converting hydrogenase Eha subunit E
MQNDKPLSFALAVLCAVAFVSLTSLSLPSQVASHFGASGMPNGFMPRGAYVGIMLAVVLGLPVVMVYGTWLAMANPDARINIPHRVYWLGPERRDATIALLRVGVMRFGVALVVFLCYVHWLVVRANAAVPVRLATPWLLGGLVAFLVASLVQVAMLVRRFRHRGG